MASSIKYDHGHRAWPWSIDMAMEHGAWPWSIDIAMDREYGFEYKAWSMAISILHGHTSCNTLHI